MKVLQKWQGWIVECTKTSFSAGLADLTNPKNPDEFATIPFKSLKESEKEFLFGIKDKRGLYFTWTISKNGNKTISDIHFSREVWTKKELDEVRKKARALCEVFGWGASKSTTIASSIVKKTTIAQDVRAEYRRKNTDLIDKETLRRNEDWSRMGHKVVGGED